MSETDEKTLYVEEIIRALKLQILCTEQAAQKVDPTLKLQDMAVCGSLADFLKGDKKRFRTPLDYPKGNYSDIDAILTFNKPDEEVARVMEKSEAKHCPCIYTPRIGAHPFVWNLPRWAPCPKDKQLSIK